MEPRFTFIQTGIEGLTVVEPRVFGDARGYFMETWSQRAFTDGGIHTRFVQDNQSLSRRGVVRGLHFQKKKPQGKLVRVVSGCIWDVGVDIRPDSPTFGHWRGVELSAGNKRMFYVPEGFAHGFLVLSEAAEVAYKCTRFYDPADEGGIHWDDPTLAIRWPLHDMAPVLSAKDNALPRWQDIQF